MDRYLNQAVFNMVTRVNKRDRAVSSLLSQLNECANWSRKEQKGLLQSRREKVEVKEKKKGRGARFKRERDSKMLHNGLTLATSWGRERQKHTRVFLFLSK